MARISVTLIALALALGYAAAETERAVRVRATLAAGQCAAFPVALSGDLTRYELSIRGPAAESVRLSGVWTGCITQGSDGCVQLADASPAACEAAVDSGATAASGSLSASSADSGFLYAANDGVQPVPLDVLVVLRLQQPVSQSAGSYRRALRRRLREDSNTTTTIVPQDASGGTPTASGSGSSNSDSSSDSTTTIVPQDTSGNSGSSDGGTGFVSTSDTPTSDAPTGSSSESRNDGNYIDRIANNFDNPEVRKWVKIAIIILIVLVCLSILSCAFCILRCICWPCCCAARGFK